MTPSSKRIFAKNEEISNDTHETQLNNNDLIIGPSGAGKTTGYVIPNLINTYGSMIVADTKGNLHRKFSNYLKNNGYTVRVIDLSDLKHSCSYNPLDYIDYTSPTDYSQQDVISLAAILCPVKTERDPFWEKSAQTVIASLIAYVLEALPREEHNMVNVTRLYRTLTTETGKNLFRSLEMELPGSYAVKLYHLYAPTTSVEKTWACITQFISNALWLFDFNESERVFGRKSDFDFRELGEKNCVFFLNLSDTDRSMDTIVDVFYTQALQSLVRLADSKEDNRLAIPVRIILDDFATNTYIPNFDKIISVIRSRDISVSVILQSISQLRSLYNEGQATTIMNNCDHILYLGGQDIETANFISHRTNKTPETILNQSVEKAYLITRGQKAKEVIKNGPNDYTIPDNSDKNDDNVVA